MGLLAPHLLRPPTKHVSKKPPIESPFATWSPSSWQAFEARQQPFFEDDVELGRVLERLAVLPPLVTPWEINRLQQNLVEASAGKRFLLQGGDCAERFDECRPDIIANRLKVLLQMSLVLIYGLRMPVIRVGRFAGQYAKPRSADFEGQGAERLPTYRGDMVNAPEFGRQARRPAPERMITAYERSTMTLNYVRALGEGGFADLRHPEYWDLDFVTSDHLRAEYQAIVDSILDALRFTEAVSPSDQQYGSGFVLHKSRSPAPPVRGSLYPSDLKGLLQSFDALPLDRKTNQYAGQCPRGVRTRSS